MESYRKSDLLCGTLSQDIFAPKQILKNCLTGTKILPKKEDKAHFISLCTAVTSPVHS